MTCAPSPLRRSMEMPVIRCSDSARFVSGNLPMSSAANRVDHADRRALDVHRHLQAFTQAGDDHLLQILRRRILGVSRIDQYDAAQIVTSGAFLLCSESTWTWRSY